MDIEERLQAVEDRQAIEELAATYCQWFDDHRWADITGLFHEDAVFDILARVEGRHKIAQFFDDLTTSDLGPTWHYDLNRRISIEGDTAYVESMFVCPCIRDGEQWLAAGRYRDVVRKVDGEWRYAIKRGRFHYFMPASAGWAQGEYGFAEALRAAERR